MIYVECVMQKKRSRSNLASRGFTKEQNEYLEQGYLAILDELKDKSDPVNLLEILRYILKHKEYMKLEQYLKHDKFATEPRFCELALSLHAIFHNPRNTDLFKNIPRNDDDEEEEEFSPKQLETLRITVKEKIDLEMRSLAKFANAELSDELKKYFRESAIIPFAKNIAEFNHQNLNIAISILNLVRKSKQTVDEFLKEFSAMLAKAYGGNEVESLNQQILQGCQQFWEEKESDVPTLLFTQKIHDICSAACNLFMLMSTRTAQRSIFVKKCHLNNADGSNLSSQQVKALTILVANELKFYVDSLSDAKIVPRVKWQLFKEEKGKLEAEVARLTVELAAKPKPPITLVLRNSSEPPRSPIPQVMPDPEPEFNLDDDIHDYNDSDRQVSEDASFEYSASSDNEEAQGASPKKGKIVELTTENSKDSSLIFAEECLSSFLFNL